MPTSVMYAVPSADALVGGLHVRVRADDGRDAAVEVPAHRDFLRGRLGVEVHEHDRRFVTDRVDLVQHDAKRIVDRRHEDAAHELTTPTGTPFARARDEAAASRRARGRFAGRSSRGWRAK